ncbi:MAG: hypothetical protein FWG90_00565 [Oscillospiraceae bacterium]|nr:hypothetical protein [Oscillospiraceae bacterium]
MGNNNIKVRMREFVESLLEIAVSEYHETGEYKLLLEKREYLYSVYRDTLSNDEFLLTKDIVESINHTYIAENEYLFKKAVFYGASFTAD